MNIVFSEHAMFRMSIRDIREYEVLNVIKNPQKVFYDLLTGYYIAIGSRDPAIRGGHSLVIAYTLSENIIRVVTVIDVKNIDNIVGRRLSSGRWVELK